MTDQTIIHEGNDAMKRKRVSLGTSSRPPPTSGYVRKRIGNVRSNSEPLPKNVANHNLGLLSPSKGGSNNNPILEGKEEVNEVAILEKWRQLDRSGQRAVLAKMSFELQNTSSSEESRDVDLWAVAVTSALREALGPSDGAGHGPQVVRRLLGASSAWTPVAEFIATGRIGNLRPAERLAVFDLLAKLLVERAKRVAARADIPLSAKLVAQNAVHIAGIFDNAFPGYLANGLVGAVSRMLIAKPTAAVLPTPRVRLN